MKDGNADSAERGEQASDSDSGTEADAESASDESEGGEYRGRISRRRVLQSAGAGLTTGAFSGVSEAANHGEGPPGPPPENERYNVGLRAGEEEPGLAAATQAADAVRKTIDFGPLWTVVNGRFSAEAREALRNNPHTEYVEPDVTDYTLDEQTTPWGLERIGADQLYTADTVGTESGMTVAVLDTGIDSDHPGLQSNTITGKAFGNTCGEDQGTDCCPNKTRTCSGYNGNDCHENWDDDDDHGTHVAGTIAADDDAEDVLGILPNVDLLAGKVFDGCGNTSASDIADAIKWATDEGADVINMSFSGGGSTTGMKACDYAHRRNVVLVASAGNAGYCTDCVGAPANYSTVIGVSNLNLVDSLRSDSSTGSEVELAAPGTETLSLVPPESSSSGTAYKGGTSMAAPHVAGTAALIKEITSLSTNEEIRARLRESAENIDVGPDDQGYGLVDALEATDGLGSPDDPQFAPYVDTVEITDDWHTFSFGGKEFSDPVVVAGPPTLNGWAPTTVRVRNVTGSSAEIRLQEWLFQNGEHLTEDVTVAVFERGHLMELNGVRAETGHVTGVDENWQTVSLQDPYTDGTTPIVIPQCVTWNGWHPVTTRVRNVDENSFDIRLQEEEAQGPHTTEQVDYLAIEPHTILESELDSVATTTGDEVDHSGTSVSLFGFDNRPDLLAQTQTFDGGDPCNLRVSDWDASGFDVHVDEETSGDDETSHTTETVGYVALENFNNEAMTYETGTGTTDQPDRDTWHPVRGTQVYDDPVVVTGPLTDNGAHPTTTRVRNIGKAPTGRTTFEFQLEEWEYLNGPHVEEKVSYGIFEAGAGTIGSGTVDAGYVTDVSADWETVSFTDEDMFEEPPIVITQCTTQSGGDPVTVRTRDVGTFGFQVRLQEEEANGPHYTERVDYVAIERGDFSGVDVSDTGNTVTDTPLILDAYDGFSDPPDLLASMQTTDGPDTAALRFSAWDESGFGVFIEEEQSADSETTHTDENVGYAAFTRDEPGQLDREVATTTTDQSDGSAWHPVETDFFSFPIVVMGPPTHNGWHPMTVRTRNVQNDSFEFQFDEWDYRDGSHDPENVSYAVFEGGRGTLDAAGNATAEAGAVAAREKWERVRFSYTTDFSTTPVVCVQIGGKGGDCIAVRVRNITTEGFEVRVQEQESKDVDSDESHTRERVDYIAAEPIDTEGLTVARTSDVVTSDTTPVSLSGFTDRPHVLAQIQTYDGGDPCNLRVSNWDSSGFDVHVDEETSGDDETSHTTENVGYIAFE